MTIYVSWMIIIQISTILYIMPSHCCVTGCRSNYAATKDQQCEIISALKFPEDPILRALWIKKMPRENLEIY